MPLISKLKEGYAFASIQERQGVVDRLAVPNTEDHIYYNGLLTLQNLYNEVMKPENPLELRSPTSIENELCQKMNEILKGFKMKNATYRLLEARFHLLAYPFQTVTTLKYLKKELQLNITRKTQQGIATTVNFHGSASFHASSPDLPTSLDVSLISDSNIIQNELKKIMEKDKHIRTNNFEDIAIPYLDPYLNGLNKEAQAFIINARASRPFEHEVGPEFLPWLADYIYFKAIDPESKDYMPPLSNFTLSQMDELIKLIPDIVLKNEDFVKEYALKLVPEYYHDIPDADFWDGCELDRYLNRIEDFANILPDTYRPLKTVVKLCQLRIDIAKLNFNPERFLEYLTHIEYKPSATKVIPFSQVKLPIITTSNFTQEQCYIVMEEYIFGLIAQQKMTDIVTQSFSKFYDIQPRFKEIYANAMLTASGTPSNDLYGLSHDSYMKLVKKSFISFAYASSHVSIRRKPSDVISLFVKTKNIQRLTIRVFQIDTENYWRTHLHDNDELAANSNINLDGFQPTVEQEFDYSSEPAIQIKINEFKFGEGGLAPEVFSGRGLWIIEFIGDDSQCRAVVQKGYLKVITQTSLAGHILRVLDEEGQVVEKAKVILNNNTYETDEARNILIPYRENNKVEKIIISSCRDSYCEPATFEHCAEKYMFDAKFYVNTEMISFNKIATVIAVPSLTLNEVFAPLSLLNDEMTLTVTTTDINGVKNTNVCQRSDPTSDTISFDFMVPEHLSNIFFQLKSDVNTTGGSKVDVKAKHTIMYNSSSTNSSIAQFYLKKRPNGKYELQVFGRNGEPKSDCRVQLKLTHILVKVFTSVSLQTNESGIIELGDLKNIRSIELSLGPNMQSVNASYYKTWELNNDSCSVLPRTLCTSEYKEIRLACNTSFIDSLYSIYSVNDYNLVLLDFTSYIKKENNFITIRGLPAGKYRLYLPTMRNEIQQIECTVIKEIQSEERGIWSNWIVSEDKYAKGNGSFLQKPLSLAEIRVTDTHTICKLNNSNSKTYAIITTTTFVPSTSESLFSSIVAARRPSESSPVFKNGVKSTRSLFLNDKYISEEYQYILKRVKAEKWTSSNLTKPTLLLYPKKNSSTQTNARDYAPEKVKPHGSFRKNYSDYKNSSITTTLTRTSISGITRNITSTTNVAFLDHHSPVIVIPVSKDGEIIIDNKYFDNSGSLFQMVVISGEQTIFHQQVMEKRDELKLKDLRQSDDGGKVLIRLRTASIVSPNEKLVLHTNEYETIDSFEKLFDTIVRISKVGKIVDEKFSFLKNWPNLSLQKKLKLYQEHACHEFNLWLKKKDMEFFDTYVKPFIKTKIRKDFMDLYLTDEDLSDYQEHIYVQDKLSIAEKSLLASVSSSEFLQSVLMSARDRVGQRQTVDRSSTIFDTIISQSTLLAAAEATTTTDAARHFTPMQSMSNNLHNLSHTQLEQLQSRLVQAQRPLEPSKQQFQLLQQQMSAAATLRAQVPGGSMFGFGSTNRAAPPPPPPPPGSSSQALFSAAPPPPPMPEEIEVESTFDEQYDTSCEDDDYSNEQIDKMREKAKTMKEKVAYKFVENTSEWVETGYYSTEKVELQEFWLDYLEHLAISKDAVFLSENFVYSLGNMKEVLFVLCLMDLPFASEVDWKVENNIESNSNKIDFSIFAGKHPLLVFYRTLSEYNGTVKDDGVLMLRQEIFVVDEKGPIISEESVKINPSNQTLETHVEYGHHFIVINTSSKRVSCQLTIQIPTGSVPTNNTYYYRSKPITIEAYSTWHEVVSTFYFPLPGEFTMLPVPALSLEDNQLIGKFDAIPLKLEESSSQKVIETAFHTGAPTIQEWNNIAAKGTPDSVISLLNSYRGLDKLNFGLIEWRMKNESFARQVFNVLKKRHYYVKDLWKYGVSHRFEDIIQDLILCHGSTVYSRIGPEFESPLITKHEMPNIYDYFPLFNARSHQLNAAAEILNDQFYEQYNRFLHYLCLRSSLPSDNDLIVWTNYLILQDRISEAQEVFQRINQTNDNLQCQVQIDYLQAYLKTRMRVTEEQYGVEQIDLQSIKDIAEKYKDYSVPKWRQMFANLHEFVREVEQGDLAFLDNSGYNKRIRSEPILEFEIDEQEQELLIKYANINSVSIKYHDMNVEVMFSNNPFMAKNSYKSAFDENVSWIKPSYSEVVALPEKMEVDESNEAEDFDIIGIGQVNSLQTYRVPFNTENKNIFIEVSSGSLKRHQAYYANSLSVHVAESFGFICVTSKDTKRPLSGIYIKVYCRMKNGKQTNFWKDGYTGLNGVFDYISVTQGNALTAGNKSLKTTMSDMVEKLSILVLSTKEGAVVKEVYPPAAN